MIDVHMLLMKLQRVEDDLEVLKSASSQAELIEGMERFGDSAHELMTQVNKISLTLCGPAFFWVSHVWFHSLSHLTNFPNFFRLKKDNKNLKILP